MTKIEINKLIDRFLNGDMSDHDFQTLESELISPESEEIIEEMIETDTYTSPNFNLNPDISKSYNEVSEKLGFSKARRSLRNRLIKYAAIFVGLLGIVYFYQMFYLNDSNSLPLSNENDITLQLENGNIEIITESGDKKVIDKNGEIVGTQSGDKLTYKIDEGLEKLSYNTLKVPNGKTFELELSDGTHIHLNAGSSLKYPINFIKGQDRRIFLEGEAYFDVAKDPNHPFIVSAGALDIRVLGTEFNVSSYTGVEDVNTVLVEGSVAIYKDGDTYNEKSSTHLTPGHIATWSNVDKNISIDEVDTSEYTSWIDGKMIFKRRTFKEIIQVLERHFDIEIVNNYDSLNSQRFLASFDTENIEQILEYFKKTNNFNYEIVNNKIIINQP